MHILLVNDDGINDRGIVALYKAIIRRGHDVTVCAPQTQQSAMSQRISLIEPLYVRPYPDMGKNAFAIAGSPTDCVRLGLRQLIEKPVDLCLSGINDGHNAGFATYYSGTVGAAREAALVGVKAIAASIQHRADNDAVKRFAEMCVIWAERCNEVEFPKNAVLNINAPRAFSTDLSRARRAPLCTSRYIDMYIRADSPRQGTLYWMDINAEQEPPETGSDIDLLNRGYVTYTFMGAPKELVPSCGDAFMLESVSEEV